VFSSSSVVDIEVTATDNISSKVVIIAS